ncbi:hypothetical protein ACFL2S_12265 [Thermodesulfobacteriota bacterium]
MGTHLIEVDDRVFKYLQSHAEPLIDTPNSVLIKLLFDEEKIVIQTKKPSISVSGLPKSLAYVLEVISEIEMNGHSRLEATKIVAERNDTVPTTVMDKYARQLDLKAMEVDELLKEPGYNEFKNLLKSKYSTYKDLIDIYFGTMITQGLRLAEDTVSPE